MSKASRYKSLILGLCSLFQACVSYEPAILVPAITLSAESVELGSHPDSSLNISFGLDVAVNESDSLFNIEALPGVLVRRVDPNGPAENAGIESGDILLAINGVETNHPDAVISLQQNETADSYLFEVQRNTTVFEATVTAQALNTNPPPVELYRSDQQATRAGYQSQLVRLDNETEVIAARVARIFEDSPLPAAGINTGDLIIALEGRELNSAQDLISRLNMEHQLGERVSLTRYDGQTVSEVSLQLWNPGRRLSRITFGPLLQYESSLNPPRQNFSLLDLWLFSLYDYQKLDGERSHSILGIINLSSDYGELVEESNVSE